MKRLALISDISGFGNCSLTASLPIVSSYGIQPCPMPTAVFSRQTGFDDYYHRALTEEMLAVFEDWKQETFDGIYTGYFVNAEQIAVVTSFIQDHPEARLCLVDPIMGDDGARYDTVDDALIEAYQKLIQTATVITPNVTELALLTGRDPSKPFVGDEMDRAARSLLNDPCSTVIVTGIHSDANVYNRIYQVDAAPKQIGSKFYFGSYSGTGDIFSSIVASQLLNGKTTVSAVKTAVKQINRMFKQAIKDPSDARYGLPVSIK